MSALLLEAGGAGLNPLRWGVANRPTPSAVRVMVCGLLAASAGLGALSALAVLEVATRRWPDTTTPQRGWGGAL